jgi:hypothetical protein
MLSVYSTIALLGVVNKLEQFQPFLLNLFFPEVALFNDEKIALDKVAKGLSLAPFVSPMVGGKIQRGKGSTTVMFAPACLKPKDVVDPSRMIKRMPGEGIGGVLSTEQRRDAIVTDITLDQRNKISRRLEWMAAQVLLTGKVVVEGDDYPTVEVDFKRDAANTITKTGAGAWGAAGVSPVDQLEEFAHKAEAPITTVVMGKTAWKHLRADLKGDNKDLLDTRRGSRSQMELGPSAGMDVSYKGTLGSDMEIWVYTGQYDDADGNKKTFIGDNQVILGSPAIEGVRAFGAILTPGAGYKAMEYYPRHWVGQDVEMEFIETQSAPLIIPARPDASVCATVCASAA